MGVIKKGLLGDLLGGNESTTAPAQSTSGSTTSSSGGSSKAKSAGDNEGATSTTSAAKGNHSSETSSDALDDKTVSATGSGNGSIPTSAEAGLNSASGGSKGSASTSATVTKVASASASDASDASATASLAASSAASASETETGVTASASQSTGITSASATSEVPSGTASAGDAAASLVESTTSASSTSDSIVMGSDTVTQAAAATVFLSDSVTASASATRAMAAANNVAASTENSHILDPSSKLFPLGMVIVILGGLFVIVISVVLFIRLFGWNSKRRRVRSALPSFIESDPSFDPKGFETITTNIASSGNPSGGYGATDESVARPIRAQYIQDKGPFVDPYDGAYFFRDDEKLETSAHQGLQEMGSPVPSFHTGRQGWEQPLAMGGADTDVGLVPYGYPIPGPAPVQSEYMQGQRNLLLSRSNTKASNNSEYALRSGVSQGAQVQGPNAIPSQAGWAGGNGVGYPQQAQRVEKRWSGGGESFRTVSSGRSGGIGRLEKGKPWGP